MSSKYEYQPFYNDDQNVYLLRIRFHKFAWATVSLPLFGFIFCVFWSIVFNFDESTSTHCGVQNILPSISAAIGNYSPQRELWQLAIGLHAIPRFIVAFMYKKYHTEVLFPWAYSVSTLTCLLNIIENICLVGLSFWTSSEDYRMFYSSKFACVFLNFLFIVSAVHKTCFVTFIVTSELYMILTCLLFKRCRRHPPIMLEITSLKWKINLLLINVINILLASYFFMRHNSYCETGGKLAFFKSVYIRDIKI